MNPSSECSKIVIGRKAVYALVSAAMALMGTAFSTAAFAAGVQSTDVLAFLFFMGAASALLVLVTWCFLQLRAP